MWTCRIADDNCINVWFYRAIKLAYIQMLTFNITFKTLQWVVCAKNSNDWHILSFFVLTFFTFKYALTLRITEDFYPAKSSTADCLLIM